MSPDDGCVVTCTHTLTYTHMFIVHRCSIHTHLWSWHMHTHTHTRGANTHLRLEYHFYVSGFSKLLSFWDVCVCVSVLMGKWEKGFYTWSFPSLVFFFFVLHSVRLPALSFFWPIALHAVSHAGLSLVDNMGLAFNGMSESLVVFAFLLMIFGPPKLP